MYFLYGQLGRRVASASNRCGRSTAERRVTATRHGRSSSPCRTSERDAGALAAARRVARRAHSCAFNRGEQGVSVRPHRNPSIQEAGVRESAQEVRGGVRSEIGPAARTPTPSKKKPIWREAAGLYEAARSTQAPGRDEAPGSGDERGLRVQAGRRVQQGDRALQQASSASTAPDARSPPFRRVIRKTKAAADPKKYARARGTTSAHAYDALRTTYYSFFNYKRAAETYEKVSANDRFDEKRRRDAAKNAMILYANMGQRDKMLGRVPHLRELHPTAEDKADADYRVADLRLQAVDCPRRLTTGHEPPEPPRRRRRAHHASLAQQQQSAAGAGEVRRRGRLRPSRR